MINFFKIYDNALPDSFCDEAISFFEKSKHLITHGMVSGAEKNPKKIKKIVKNTKELDISFLLNDKSILEYDKLRVLEDTFTKHSIEYTSKYLHGENYIDKDTSPSWNDILKYLETRDGLFSNKNVMISNFLPKIEKIATSGYRIKKYSKEFGYYNYHADAAFTEVDLGDNRWRLNEGRYYSNIRLLSVIMYLNTVEDGGETTFPLIPIKIKPVKGRIAVFPTHWTYLHKAEVPVSNDKYSMNTFISAVV